MEDKDFNTATAEFISWLSSTGVQINPKVAISDLRLEGKNRGAVASADIEADEVLFSIPRSAVLNTETVLSDPYYSPLRNRIMEMPGWLALTTVLLVESSRHDSNWAPYLAILPAYLDSLIFWSRIELDELQASTVQGKIGKADAEGMFLDHVSPLNIDNIDIAKCHRWASIIMAYAFDIPDLVDTENQDGHDDEGDELVSEHDEDEKTILSMIPLADILNADAERNNARLCCDNENLEMRAVTSITKGNEIFNDYGQLPTSEYEKFPPFISSMPGAEESEEYTGSDRRRHRYWPHLVRRYGFATANYALYDVAELPTPLILSFFSNPQASNPHLMYGHLQLDASDLSKRIDLAQREGIYEDSYDLAAHAPTVPDELLALLYILLLDEENFSAIERSETELPSRSKLSAELVGKVLVDLVRLRETQYSSTLEEDESLARVGTMSHRRSLALQVRMGEKRVLRKAMQEATKYTGSDKRLRVASGNGGAAAGGMKRRPEENGKERKRAKR